MPVRTLDDWEQRDKLVMRVTEHLAAAEGQQVRDCILTGRYIVSQNQTDDVGE